MSNWCIMVKRRGKNERRAFERAFIEVENFSKDGVRSPTKYVFMNPSDYSKAKCWLLEAGWKEIKSRDAALRKGKLWGATWCISELYPRGMVQFHGTNLVDDTLYVVELKLKE